MRRRNDFIAKPFQWLLLTQRIRYSLKAAAPVDAGRQALETLARAQQLARIFGMPADQVHCASPEHSLQRVVAADRDRMRRVRSQLRNEGKAHEQMYVIERFDGVLRTVYEQAQVVRDARDKPLRMEGVAQDITDREFFQKLVAAGLEHKRGGARPCAVLHLDVDRFKSVNGALDVAAGDMVLGMLAERLKLISRG